MPWSSPVQPVGGAWWSAALASPTAMGCALVLTLVSLAAAGLLILLWRVSRRSPTAHSAAARPAIARLCGDGGTATVEFALMFPVLMFLVLLLIQTTLLFTGNLFVHYAAFSATRTAAVEVPQDYPGEPANRVASQDSGKLETIRRTAMLAMWPVSGPGTPVFGSVAAPFNELYGGDGNSAPRWIGELLDKRLGYADRYTRVELYRVEAFSADDTVEFALVSPRPTQAAELYAFAPREPVRVVVSHDMHLSVPYVSKLFSDGGHDTADGSAPYAAVTGSFLLTSEGVSAALPDKPPVPRNPALP